MAYNLVESKTISVETSGENIRLKATGDFSKENVVVESIRTKNIFGNYTIINGYLFETRMSIRTGASDRLAFIECKPNTISRSVITTSFRVSDYTSIPPMTDSYVDYTVPTVVENNSGTTMTYTTSSTAKYLVIHYGNAINDTATDLTNTLKTMQVEEGTTASEFSPYQNLNGTENYTTEEIIIGKWINGKPIYRKVVDCGALPNNAGKYVAHNISNIESIIRLYGFGTTGQTFYPIPNETFRAYANLQNIFLYTQDDRSNMNGTFIIEYTKTTD